MLFLLLLGLISNAQEIFENEYSKSLLSDKSK